MLFFFFENQYSKFHKINTKIDEPFKKWVDKFSVSTKEWLIEEDIDLSTQSNKESVQTIKEMIDESLLNLSLSSL